MKFRGNFNYQLSNCVIPSIVLICVLAVFHASCSHPQKAVAEVPVKKSPAQSPVLSPNQPPVQSPVPSPQPTYAPTTSIPYSIKDTCHVTLVLYNVAGQLIDTLVNEVQPPGDHQFKFASEYFIAMVGGVYFYKVDACGDTATKKVVILK